jgi:hypothetical protein
MRKITAKEFRDWLKSKARDGQNSPIIDIELRPFFLQLCGAIFFARFLADVLKSGDNNHIRLFADAMRGRPQGSISQESAAIFSEFLFKVRCRQIPDDQLPGTKDELTRELVTGLKAAYLPSWYFRWTAADSDAVGTAVQHLPDEDRDALTDFYFPPVRTAEEQEQLDKEIAAAGGASRDELAEAVRPSLVALAKTPQFLEVKRRHGLT